jgi:hypothetical protein
MFSNYVGLSLSFLILKGEIDIYNIFLNFSRFKCLVQALPSGKDTSLQYEEFGLAASREYFFIAHLCSVTKEKPKLGKFQ